MKRQLQRPLMGLAATLLVAGGLVACSGGGDAVDVDGDTGTETDGGTADGAAGGTLVAAIGGEPDQLDPNSTTAYFAFQVLENVFDTLVEPDANLEMQPALAESWTVSDDQLTWTFALRDDVTWHDGSPFTSADVVYSYNRIIDEELANSWRFSSVEEVTAPDDHTVEIAVSAPSPNLLANIGGFKGLAIVQEANVESGDIGSNPIGTGPFVFESWSSGQSIELSANPDFWGGAPAIDGVEFRFISEPSTAVAALTSGEVHWTDNIPPQQVDTLEGDDRLELGQVGSNDYWYLALNQNNEPFDQVEVRQAIAFAIDREGITQATMFGNATVNQTAIPESSLWYTEFTEFSFDQERATELLDDAGVDPASIPMEIMVATDYPETVTAAQIIVDQLSQIGISATIKQLDFGTWLDAQGEGDFDMLMMGWLGNLDPDDFYYSQHHSAGGNNYQGFSNSRVDELLEQGRVETDEAVRYDIYAEVAHLVAREASYIYLYNPDVIQAWTPALEGYDVMANRAVRFRDVALGE